MCYHFNRLKNILVAHTVIPYLLIHKCSLKYYKIKSSNAIGFYLGNGGGKKEERGVSSSRD
ncbi:MAG: hypothetical protein CV087_06870 [Candidatus Brocadia sp. WS118]|nr:MAG: hypothetical protein CV087_06870 [Candidatus Brocadia sp. WS118]